MMLKILTNLKICFIITMMSEPISLNRKYVYHDIVGDFSSSSSHEPKKLVNHFCFDS